MVRINKTKTLAIVCIFISSMSYSYQTTERSNRMNNVTTTPSGLKIEILESSKTSNAKKPQSGKIVTVHYTGWLMTRTGEKGAMFDSSHKRGQPFQFILGRGQVIKGWDEGIAQLVVGDKARLTIPANLAYGNRSVGGIIPANATLIFDVELIDAA
jgi:FKBP-type peptidyl-prolyl cis-trans isomerase